MKKYLVGGAVRNILLKLPVTEKDWVVTGSSPQEMLAIGYQQVGKDFPVFLHPENHEEYALARTERKSGQGYTGFNCYTDPSITIEEDLYRRDLTINAMAYDIYNGNLVDPYHGQRDIHLKILRHVSHAFYEDPLRVLRVARFSAQLAHMKFTIAPETLTLMKKMIHELPLLPPERIWIETKKALITKNPQIYFHVLRRCGALNVLFPEIDTLFKIPVTTKWSSKTSSLGHHAMMSLAKAVSLTNDLSVRFSVLCLNLTQRIINKNIQQHNLHHIPNKINTTLVKELCNRLKIPRYINELAILTTNNHEYFLNEDKLLSPEILMTLFANFDCWRNPKRIEQIICIKSSEQLTSMSQNNTTCSSYIYQKSFLHAAFTITKTVKVNDIIQDGFTGSNIKSELYSRRLHVLKKWQYQK